MIDPNHFRDKNERQLETLIPSMKNCARLPAPLASLGADVVALLMSVRDRQIHAMQNLLETAILRTIEFHVRSYTIQWKESNGTFTPYSVD